MNKELNTSIDRIFERQREIMTWCFDLYKIALEKDTEENKLIKAENHYKKL